MNFIKKIKDNTVSKEYIFYLSGEKLIFAYNSKTNTIYIKSDIYKILREYNHETTDTKNILFRCLKLGVNTLSARLESAPMTAWESDLKSEIGATIYPTK